MNPTTRALIKARDWEAIAEIWNTFRPDDHGIQRPTIPAKVRDQLRAEARKDGVELPQ
jgi:hypothetical protein